MERKENQTPQKENQTAQPVKIAVTDETGAEVTLFVLEETKINGMSHLPVEDAVTSSPAPCPAIISRQDTEEGEVK